MNEINEIKIPKGVNRISVKQHDDRVVIEFIPEEPKYKDGDFVINKRGDILIFKKKDENKIYDHAFFNNVLGLSIAQMSPSYSPIRRHATEEEKQKMLDALEKEGKRWNAEKKCIEDIPVRKFKKGDKVRIKDGISSKTHHSVAPNFVTEMDDFIGKTMTVNRYTDIDGYVVCNGYGWCFHENWLEPWSDEPKNGDELKKGDWAIFWDSRYLVPSMHLIRLYHGKTSSGKSHIDNFGTIWDNAVKWDGTKEQFEKVLRGEI